jgi:hypothetical protein
LKAEAAPDGKTIQLRFYVQASPRERLSDVISAASNERPRKNL